MENKKVAFGLIAACLLLAANVRGEWVRLADPPQRGADPGSSLCAGTSIRQGMPTDWVWFLQNPHSAVSNWYFSKYDIVNNTWDSLSLPFTPGRGAALVCVGGRVFAFRGDNTNEFWVYFDGENTWYQAPPVPQSVIDGGVLCYGGIQQLVPGGETYYVLYAFTGQEYEVIGEDWRGYFWRYCFKKVQDEGPLLGSWQRLSDIPGKTHQYFPCLTWLPMNDPSNYPMGLVVAMKNYQDYAHFHLYNPDEDEWFAYYRIPHPTRPNKYVQLTGGASITSHYRDSTMFLLGESYERYYGFYDVVNNTVSFGSPTPQPVRGGAAIAAIWRGGYEQSWEGIAYAEFGTQDTSSNPGFYRWLPPSEQEGGQGVGINPASRVKVAVHPNRTSHIFSVKCAPGPVKLSVMDVTGRKLTSLSAKCYNGNVDITYNHPIIQSGVYFWKVSTLSGDANGKLVIAK